MFQITQRILIRTEAYLLKLPTEKKLWGLATRYLIFPFKYLFLGLKDFFKPASLWSLFAFVLMIIGAIVVEKLSIPVENRAMIVNIAGIFPLVLVIFSVPSTYAYNGVEENYVNETSKLIKDEELDTPEKIKLLEKNLEKISSRIYSRVSFYKWLVGAAWAMYLLFFNLEMRYLITQKLGDSNNKLLSENISSFVITLFATLTALVLIFSYKRASEILMKSIEYGCTQCEYELLQKE